MSQSRPFGVTPLLLLVLSLSAWGALRLAATLRWWSVLTEFGSSLSVWYLSIGGAGWLVVGGALFWALAARKRYARSALLISIVLWYCQYWVERIFFQAPHSNTAFVLIVMVILLAAIVADINLPSVKNYFMKSEEHEQADKTSKAT